MLYTWLFTLTYRKPFKYSSKAFWCCIKATLFNCLFQHPGSSLHLLAAMNQYCPTVLLAGSSYALPLANSCWSKYLSAEGDWLTNNQSPVQRVDCIVHMKFPNAFERTNHFVKLLTVYFWLSLSFQALFLATFLNLVMFVRKLSYKHSWWVFFLDGRII